MPFKTKTYYFGRSLTPHSLQHPVAVILTEHHVYSTALNLLALIHQVPFPQFCLLLCVLYFLGYFFLKLPSFHALFLSSPLSSSVALFSLVNILSLSLFPLCLWQLLITDWSGSCYSPHDWPNTTQVTPEKEREPNAGSTWVAFCWRGVEMGSRGGASKPSLQQHQGTQKETERKFGCYCNSSLPRVFELGIPLAVVF